MTHRSFLISALLCSTTLPAMAQQVVTLDEITISGTGLETQVFDSPSSVSVITAEEIAARPRASVAQMLSEIPGVLVTQQGIERIRIRGETSRRVAIELDGQQLTDHSGYGQPVLIDPASIERIEIVRGSSSVVSGTQAIGGVVNIITKRGADKPIGGTFSTAYFGATDGYRTSASIGGTQGNFDWRLNFGRSEQGDKDTPNGTLDPSDIQDDSGSIHLGYRMGNHYFGLGASAYDLSANVFVPEDPAYLDFSIELPKRDLRKSMLFYEGTDLAPWLTSLRADVYDQTIDREFRNTIAVPAGPPGAALTIASTSVDEQRTSGVNLRAEMEFAAGHRTVFGLEYEDDRLRSDKLTTTTMTGFGPFPMTRASARSAEADVKTSSVYLQHEAPLSAGLTATAGLRYYHVKSALTRAVEDGVAQPLQSASDDRWMASAGLVYAASENTRLRARISQGYTYPTLQQLFLTTTGGGTTIQGNPDLKPETATTFEVGARHDGGPLLLDATLFYTASDDYIASIATGPRSAAYRNINEARSWGLELLAEYEIGDWTPYISSTFIERELRYGNGTKTKDSGTPKIFGTLGLRRSWDLHAGQATLDMFAQGEGPARVRDETGTVTAQSAGYTTFNMRGTLAFDNGWTLSAEALNLFDKSYDPIDELPGAGRNLNLLASFTF